MKMMNPYVVISLLTALVVSCGPVTSYEEEHNLAVLLYVEYFNVPDSTTRANIPISLKGTFGETSAFRFDRINIVRNDSLFLIGAWGRQVYKTGATYPSQYIGIDTVLILTSPLTGVHYVEVIGAQGVLRDSTTVY
jgi:hypothetical protein